MKRTLIILSTLIALCAVSSCKKEPVNEHPLEGTWGFMSEEYVLKNADGTIFDQGKKEYNPFNPTNSDDMKLEITWTSGDDYSCESYSWHSEDGAWILNGSAFKVVIKNGNKFYAERMGGELYEVGTITITGDTFTVESTRNILSLLDETPSGTSYSKETYKRMK